MTQESTFRDELARERTVMANEQTLLAYGRTVLGLLGVAVLIFKFSDATVGISIGMIVLFGAALLIFWGIKSYRLAHLRINGEEQAAIRNAVFVEVD